MNKIARECVAKSVGTFVLVFAGTGALCASLTLRLLFIEHNTLGATLPRNSAWRSAALEFLLAFMLMFVILNVCQTEKQKISSIAIGGRAGLEALFAGPISGASVNPARSLAPSLLSGHLELLWAYLLAPTSGAIFAALVCRRLR